MQMEELSRTLAREVDEAEFLAAAVAQRLAGAPPGWDWRTEGAECRSCGMLLIRLPTQVTVSRTVVLFGTPRVHRHTLTHAHVARKDGHPACAECVETPQQCLNHPEGVCDLPEPQMCTLCGEEPALPESLLYPPLAGDLSCHVCQRLEDVSLGL